MSKSGGVFQIDDVTRTMSKGGVRLVFHPSKFRPPPPTWLAGYGPAECVYVPHQALVVCRDEHISSPAAIFVLIGLGPRLVFAHFTVEKRLIPRKDILCVPFMILTPVCQIILYLSSSEFRNTVLGHSMPNQQEPPGLCLGF